MERDRKLEGHSGEVLKVLRTLKKAFGGKHA